MITAMSADPEKLAWRVHPAADRLGLGIVVFGLIVALSVLVGFWMEGIYWSFFAFAVLFLSLEAFFLPSRFELTADGVTVHKPFSNMTRPWDHFRRVVFDPVGVTLSPFARRHWLESYRAVRLRFGTPERGEGSDPTREEVRRFVIEHVDPERVHIEGLPPSRS